MYLYRWQADEVQGREYLSLSQGLEDAWSRRVVTFAWEDWRTEIPWMTLYFSVSPSFMFLGSKQIRNSSQQSKASSVGR